MALSSRPSGRGRGHVAVAATVGRGWLRAWSRRRNRDDVSFDEWLDSDRDLFDVIEKTLAELRETIA